ncbi:retrovirus-related pol polyprotein from transposon TNT 1-94 [Tanacetum coccineum]
MPNNSQGNNQEVENHRTNFKFSNNKTSVNACNNSLNAKTSNVNFVCVTYGKCVLNDNHDLCVVHYINGVNSRTRQPITVPISSREPKQNVNQSAATFYKKTVATDSTIKKPRNIIRKIYEQVSKTCSWWYPKFTPPGYKWKPRSTTGNVNPNLVEIILFIVDSGCPKHMTRNLKLLTNFVEKFLGTVKFGNDQIAPILGYGDLVQGTITIKRVYYVEGLNHNLFSVGQLCDADLEVAFWKSTCYIRDLKGNDLLTGSRGTYLYSITLQETSIPNPICLMAKATSSQAWLCYRRLSHLNFDAINLLSKNNIITGLPKLKFVKDHICSSCELGKAKRKSFHTKITPSSNRRLQLLHMDLCGPMRVESINGKKYVLVIVDDYSRYTWTHFLRSKDETPAVLIDFLTLVQRGLHAQVRTVQTDKGTKFLNKTLHAYFAKEGIRHETSTAQTPEQNGVVKRRNHTLVEAARTMLSAAKIPLFFWAEAIATTCFTQNSSLVIPLHAKTPYHIINGRKLSVKFFHIFGSLCYIVRDGENLDQMKEKVHVSSDPVPQCPTMVLKQDSLSPEAQSQENVRTHRFSKGSIDPTLFITKHGEDILLVQIYIDDIIFGSTNPKLSKRFEKLMQSKFEMSMIGELKFFLGIQIHQSLCGIFINQAKYAQEILKKHGMTSCDSIGTPMATKHLDANLSGTPVDQTKYRSMVRALMYLTTSRPDIVHTTCYCARYQAKSTEKHLTAVKRIFRYLKDTINMGLWYPKDTGFELTAFLDLDHAGCLDSPEAEYVSLSACCAQILWLRTQLTDYGFHFDKIPMYCDSKAAIAISCNPVQHSRTKHIDVRYHFIKEHVEKGIVELFFVGTEYQLADLFTKALSEDRFKYLVRRLGMRCLTPKELEVLANESA